MRGRRSPESQSEDIPHRLQGPVCAGPSVHKPVCACMPVCVHICTYVRAHVCAACMCMPVCTHTQVCTCLFLSQRP